MNLQKLCTNDTSVLMSDRQKNDSLRAAQVIFQKHSDQPGQLTSASTPTTPNGNYSLGSANSNSAMNMRRHSWQSTPAKIAATAVSNKAISPPPHNNNNTSNYYDSPSANAQAHRAALLAHMSLHPENENDRSRHCSSNGSIIEPKQSHLPRLSRASSSHNNPNINVINSHHHANSVSVDDLLKSGIAQDTERPRIRSSSSRQDQFSEPISLPSSLHFSRNSMESQDQYFSRQSSEKVRQQQQLKQMLRLQTPQSSSRPSSMYRETSIPAQSFSRGSSRQLQSSQPLHHHHYSEDYPLKSHAVTIHPYSPSMMVNDFDNQSLSPSIYKSNQSQPRYQYITSPMRPVTRTLSRVPPAKVYLNQSGEEGNTDFTADNEADANSERTVIRTRRTGLRRRDADESSASLVSSGSSGSYGMRSSWEVPRRAIQGNYGDDLEYDEINGDAYDDYYDYDDFVDEDIAEGRSLPPRVMSRVPYDSYDFPDTSSLPNLDNVTTSTSVHSLPGGPIALRLKHVQSKPGRTYKNPVKYQYPLQSQSQPQSPTQLSPKQQQSPNVKYHGALPDLIPNHTRKTKMERLKMKLFGSHHSKKKNNSPFDFSSDITNANSDADRYPAAKMAQNMRFKTTMRKEGNVKGVSGQDPSGDGNVSGINDYDSDSDDYSDSSEEQVDGKRNKGRGIGIRRKLKHTAAAVPYSDHLLHMESRHAPKTFNEDKPWKSHNDVGFVTSQERKRYEGMWVSNRCMYLDLLPWWTAMLDDKSDVNAQLPDDGLMLNLVVKDIWSRSNLSSDLLLQIYDMVDTRKDGTLDRKSFVVGMWLVDQCLYGRKLPKEIDPKVWASVDKFAVSTISSAKVKKLDKTRKKQMKKEIKNIKKDIKNVHL